MYLGIFINALNKFRKAGLKILKILIPEVPDPPVPMKVPSEIIFLPSLFSCTEFEI